MFCLMHFYSIYQISIRTRSCFLRLYAIHTDSVPFCKNHLIESASPSTGSLLIWDTGSYEVLQSERKDSVRDDESLSNSDSTESAQRGAILPENEKLIEAFNRVSTHSPSPIRFSQFNH